MALLCPFTGIVCFTLVAIAQYGLCQPPVHKKRNVELGNDGNTTEVKDNGEFQVSEPTPGSSTEKAPDTCRLTFHIPTSAFESGCEATNRLQIELDDVKNSHEDRLESLEGRIQTMMSDEADKHSFRHLEDKVYSLQMRLEKALDIGKGGSRSPVINRIMQKLRSEHIARMQLEKRLQDMEKKNQDIDCRLMGRPGVYLIRPFRGPDKMRVHCDKTWTVIQKRFNGSVDFYQNWDSYRKGFGNLDGEFWLGNDNIHYLTTQSKYKLRLDMLDWYGRRYYAEYSHFWIESVNDNYKLHVHGFTGNLIDSLIRENSIYNHNNMPFSTYDRNNGPNQVTNCAVKFHGAWWYNDCFASSLNGRFCSPEDVRDNDCIIWFGIIEKRILKEVVMKIKVDA